MYRKSIKELLVMLRNKEISVYELCTYFKQRIDKLNVIASFNPNWETEAKHLDMELNNDLPLFGIPFLVDDCFDLVGLPTTSGSLAFIDNYPQRDALLIKKLKEAGAICLGKTKMSELNGFLSEKAVKGYSSYGGYLSNNNECSSGALLAVNEGLIPFGLGINCFYEGVFSYCGIGVNEGVFRVNKHLNEISLFTKKLDDLLAVLNVMTDKNIEVKKRRKINIVVDNSDCNADLTKKITSKIKGVNYIDIPHSSILLELKKREFGLTLKEYLKDHYSLIKDLNDLFNFYLTNQSMMMKYDIDLIHAAVLRECDRNNEIEIGKLLFEQNSLRKKYEKAIGKCDALMMNRIDDSLLLSNLPIICLPNGIILCGKNDKKLLETSLYLMKYINEEDGNIA